jgi:hypothetical protein
MVNMCEYFLGKIAIEQKSISLPFSDGKPKGKMRAGNEL